MDKPLEKRLTPRSVTAIALALLAIAGAVLVLCFQNWANGPGRNQTLMGSVFKGLVLKRIELTIREYRAKSETGQPFNSEGTYEDQQTIRNRPIKYLPTPRPLLLVAVPTNPAFHETLLEQMRSQLEVAGISINGQLPLPEEPGKETAQSAPAGLPGNGYLAMDIEVEHSPGLVTFEVICRLYRDMYIPGQENIPFEIPITAPHTPRHRVRESDFHTAVTYEVEQVLRTYITTPYSLTRERSRPQRVR